MNLNDYEVIEFRDKEIGKRRRGIKIGKYLAVVPEYKIYRYKYGLLLFDITFKTIEEAIKFATWIDKLYREAFELWESDPNLNIFKLYKWTVPDGQTIYELINVLENESKRIKLDDLDGYMETARRNALVWTSKFG